MIETPGRFHSKATDHVVAGADEILDDVLQKKQSEINAGNENFKEAQAELNEAQSDFNSKVREALGTGGTVDERIANAVETEKDRAEGAEEALGGRVDTLEEAVGDGGSIDERIAAEGAKHYTKEETYNKTELHNLITTPNQGYITAIADSNTTTANLKTLIDTAAGSDKEKAGFIYRVGCWDGSQYNDTMYSEYAWIDTDYVFLSKKSQIDEVFDISAYHANTPYIDLAAALDSNNGGGVPQSLQKGGMSVKFIQGTVQSSDNKYLQYRLMKNTWSINTADWALCSEDVLIDNPEFVQVLTDSNDKVVEGIRVNGTKFISGDAEIGGNIKISGDATILGNVDVQGATYTLMQSPEWVRVIVDFQEHILCGIKADGTFSAPAGIEGLDDKLQEIITQMQQMLNEAKDKIDDKIDVFNSVFSIVDNPEYIAVETDSEDKVLSGRRTDGTKFENLPMEFKDKVSIDGNIIENIQDPEGRTEIKTDSEGKILSYRDSEGVLHENAGIETPNIILNGKNLGDKVFQNIGSKTFINVQRPKFGEFRFYGALPTDESDARTPSQLRVSYVVEDRVVFTTNCELSIQGHGSTSDIKHNFTLDLFNEEWSEEDDTYGELAVKFGDMIAVDSYHLKSCYGDLTFARRTAGGALYREMMAALPYPYNKINNTPIDLDPNQNVDCYSIADAKYCEDGFPFAFYLNDEFHGVYCLKLKKTRQNYAMQKNVKTQIFLDVINSQTYLTQPFDYTHWDLKNPKLKKYEEGTEIKDAEVLASINRLFGFLNNIPGNQADYADYIVLPHWLTTIIFNEVIGNPDFLINALSNNIELLTWDNTHWSLLPYDFDYSLGITFSGIMTSQSGKILNGVIPTQLTTLFETETKQIYTMLRNKGIIDVENIVGHYKRFTSYIPREYIDTDYKKWGDKMAMRYGSTTGSYNQIYSYINSRIEYLDSIWLNNN